MQAWSSHSPSRSATRSATGTPDPGCSRLDGVGAAGTDQARRVGSAGTDAAPTGVAEVRVPDIGDFKDVPVIEVMVKPGDTINPGAAAVTLESDKASMDVPLVRWAASSRSLKVKVGDGSAKAASS